MIQEKDFGKAIVTTQCGDVLGKKEGNFFNFKGIPYAKAERFEAPCPVTWEGVRDCTQFGKKAMQVIDTSMPWSKPQAREEFDEDCLNLNIYVPADILPREKLPVLVEIHGGAYQSGSNQEHTPEQMVKEHRIIYVAVNYRLGILGFLYLGQLLGKKYETSGNNGLLDLLASVRWIYNNIEAFGGNKDRVTVLGGSAGAKAIGALMMIPEFNTYVKQVIMSSGGTQSIRSAQTAAKTAEGFMETVQGLWGSEGKTVTPESLLTAPVDDIIRAQKIFCDNPGNTCMFGPVADGQIISADWEATAAAGTPWTGSAMIGCSRHELMFYALFNPEFAQKAPEIADALFGRNSVIAREDYERFVKNYVNQNGHEPEIEDIKNEWARILTDYMYRMYSYRLARRLSQRGCPVWQYHVEFKPALHCFDQTLAFSGRDPMFFKTEESRIQAEKTGTQVFEAFMYFTEYGHLGLEAACGKEDDTAAGSSVEKNTAAGTADLPEYLQAWKPLDPKRPQQMCWDVESSVKDIPEDDVLDHFPEAVYRL